MKRNSVKVCIRTRPTQYFAQDNIFIDEEHGTVQINTSVIADETPGLLNNKQSNFKFKFDHVFHNATQASVYDLYARDTVQGVVDGINGSVMSYGQTGSGKTFTMMGDAQSYEHRGIAPRAINQLFNEINSRIEFEFKITCTYMEIYNERIFDLLNDLSSPDQAADYTIAEEKDGRGTFVRVLQGREDPDVPWLHALELANAIRSEDVVFTLIKDGDHRLSRDQDIARLLATVGEVLSA
eukprot:gene30732-40021_t